MLFFTDKQNRIYLLCSVYIVLLMLKYHILLSYRQMYRRYLLTQYRQRSYGFPFPDEIYYRDHNISVDKHNTRAADDTGDKPPYVR